MSPSKPDKRCRTCTTWLKWFHIQRGFPMHFYKSTVSIRTWIYPSKQNVSSVLIGLMCTWQCDDGEAKVPPWFLFFLAPCDMLCYQNVELENLTGNTLRLLRVRIEKTCDLLSSWLCLGQSSVSMAATLSATASFYCSVVWLASGAPVAFWSASVFPLPSAHTQIHILIFSNISLG